MIKQEDFDKLKQLDRIEYLLLSKRIEEKSKNSRIFASFCNVFTMVFGFLILAFLGLTNIVGIEETAYLFYSIFKFFYIGFVVLFFILIHDLIMYIRENKWKKELEEKYFTKEIKPIK